MAKIIFDAIRADGQYVGVLVISLYLWEVSVVDLFAALDIRFSMEVTNVVFNRTSLLKPPIRYTLPFE